MERNNLWRKEYLFLFRKRSPRNKPPNSITRDEERKRAFPVLIVRLVSIPHRPGQFRSRRILRVSGIKIFFIGD